VPYAWWWMREKKTKAALDARRKLGGRGRKERLELLKEESSSFRQDRRLMRRKGARSRAGRGRHSLKSRRGSRWEKGEKLRLTKLEMKVARAPPVAERVRAQSRLPGCLRAQAKMGAGTHYCAAGQSSDANWCWAGGWGVEASRKAQGTDWVTFIRRSVTGALQRLDFFWPGFEVGEGDQTTPRRATSTSFYAFDVRMVPRPITWSPCCCLTAQFAKSRLLWITHSRVCLALVVGPGGPLSAEAWDLRL